MQRPVCERFEDEQIQSALQQFGGFASSYRHSVSDSSHATYRLSIGRLSAALGAQIRDILMLAVRPGLVLVAIGSAAGVVVSMFVTRVMSSLLFAVSSTDLFTFVTVPLVLAVIAVIACLIPARYATRISPAEALRH